MDAVEPPNFSSGFRHFGLIASETEGVLAAPFPIPKTGTSALLPFNGREASEKRRKPTLRFLEGVLYEPRSHCNTAIPEEV